MKKQGIIYRKRKINGEPVFGFLKANLRITRFSACGKSKVENEICLGVNGREFMKIDG